MFYFLRGSESSSEEDRLSDRNDSGTYDEDLLDERRESSSSDTKKLEAYSHAVIEAPRESSEHNHSSDELEVGPGSDDPDVESLLSESSVINRILEDDARCSFSDDLENDISTKDETNRGVVSETHAKVSIDDEKGTTATSLPNHAQFLQFKSPLKDAESQCLQDCVDVCDKFSDQKRSIHEVTTSDPMRLSVGENSRDGKKLEKSSSDDPLKFHESGENKDARPCTGQFSSTPRHYKSSEGGVAPPAWQANAPLAPSPPPEAVNSTKVERMLHPVEQSLESSSPVPLPPLESKKFRIARPTLSQRLGVCFVFMNRGSCNRSKCSFSHKVLSVLSFWFIPDGSCKFLDSYRKLSMIKTSSP